MLATSCHDFNGPGQRQEATEQREMVVKGRRLNFERAPTNMDRWELYDAYLIALSNLADSYDEMPSKIERSIEIREMILRGRKNSRIAADLTETRLRLARSYFQGGFKEEAFDLRTEVATGRILGVDLAGHLKIQGELDELSLKALGDLAESYCDRGERTRACEICNEVWERNKLLLGPEHWDTLAAKANLALSLTKLGQIRTAMTLRLELFESSRTLFGSDHIITLRYYLELAKTTSKAPGRLAKQDALKIRRKCFQVWKTRIDRGETEYYPAFIESKRAYARSLEEMIPISIENGANFFETALHLRGSILQDVQKNLPAPTKLQIAKAMNEQAECHASDGGYEEAKELRR